MSNFRQVDRETGYLPPPSVDDWLPERHLARFVVEVIEQLDLSPFVKAYRGSGSAAHHPSVLLGLLIHGYATRVYSSRKLERAIYDSVAFRFIAANDHPDHDTIATFRRRFLPAIEQLFVGVLMLARQAGILQLPMLLSDHRAPSVTELPRGLVDAVPRRRQRTPRRAARRRRLPPHQLLVAVQRVRVPQPVNAVRPTEKSHRRPRH